MTTPQDIVQIVIPQTIQDWPSFPEISTSVLLVFMMLLSRFALVRLVRGKDILLTGEQRRWISRIKNCVWIIIVLGLILIWAPELRTLALSLTAVAAALVLAGKELLLCFSGALMRTMTRPFKVGDWITIDGSTGVVVDLDAFAIHMEEIDVAGKTYQLTGRRVQVPNAKLLTNTVINEHAVRKYAYHSFSITIPASDSPEPQSACQKLSEIVHKFYEPVARDAAETTERIERMVGLDLPDAEPEITLRTHEHGHHVYQVRLFVPSRKAVPLASAITLDFLAAVQQLPRWSRALKHANIETNSEESE